MKLLGGLLILLGCFGVGKSHCRALKGRYLDLCEVLECVRILDGQIRYSNTPLSEIFGQIHRKRASTVSCFFERAAMEMEKMQGKTLQEIWSGQITYLEKQTHLQKEDRESLENFGKTLGIMDVTMQMQQLELYTVRLKEAIEEAKGQWKEKERLVPKLGLICGMVVVLILI